MKSLPFQRLLLFAAVFSSGFAVLWFLQKDPRVQELPEERGVRVTKPEEGTGLIGVPAPVVPKPGADEPSTTGSRIGLSGRSVFRRKPKSGFEGELTLTAEETRTYEEGWLELDDVHLTYPGLGTVAARRGRVIFEPGKGRLSLGAIGSRIELEDVVVELAEGHPLAPATLRAARFEGEMDSMVFDLLDQPQLDSSAVRLGGESIRLFLLEHSAVAKGSASAQMLGDAGGPGRSLGGEQLTFLAGEDGRVQLDSVGDSVLRLESSAENPEPIVLSAPAISIEGRHWFEGEVEHVELTSVVVSGGRGELASGGATASGESFDFLFDTAGRAGRVRIEGEPAAKLPTESGGTLELSADRSLTLALGRELELITTGPSILGFDGLQLAAETGFEGYRDPDAARLHFLGKGGIRLFGELPSEPGAPVRRIDYRAEELSVDHRSLANSVEIDLTSTGRTQLDIEQDDASVGTFRADEGLDLQLVLAPLQPDTWLIPKARALTFSYVLRGTRTTGSAASIVDFNPARFHLNGTELSFERFTPGLDAASDPHRVSAAGAVVRTNGMEDLVLEGNAEFPAYFTCASIRLWASRLRREGSTFVADGGVRAQLGGAPADSSFDCESLLVEGLDLDAIPPRAEHLVARGDVRCSAALGGQRLGLAAQRVELVQHALETEGLGRFKIELHASDQVQLAFEEGRYAWSVDSDELDVFAVGSPSTPPADEGNWLELAARGSLVVREASRDFFGRGEALFINRGPSSRVLLEGGAEPAYISGQLPGAIGSYRGQVTRLMLRGDGLGVDEGSFEADDLDGTLRGLFVPGSNPSDGPNLVRITCGHLKASVESLAGRVRDVVQLDDRIRISRDREEAPADSFRADHATFFHARTPGVEPGLGFDLENTSFLAHGQVRVRRGYSFLAYGDHLTLNAGSRKLYFEGTPAAMIYAGLCSQSSWVTFDAETMMLECGPGSFCMDPALIARLALEAAEEESP